MSFTGKATYSAGAALLEAVEDLSDIVSIVSPYETALLDHLGDAPRPATSTYHEWLEDHIPAEGTLERSRVGNWTQCFAAHVRVKQSDLAVRHLSVADELDYQKQERLRELLRDVEAAVIGNLAVGEGVQRRINGIMALVTSNVFKPGANSFPDNAELTEAQLMFALKEMAGQGIGQVDTIVANGFQKRQINGFINGSRSYGPDDVSYRDLVSVYESDFGICRVILSARMPATAVLLLDSTKINVLPLAGRSFHYKPLAAGGGYEAGQVIGEYTLELRNENAHGIITGLRAA